MHLADIERQYSVPIRVSMSFWSRLLDLQTLFQSLRNFAFQLYLCEFVLVFDNVLVKHGLLFAAILGVFLDCSMVTVCV